MQEPWVRSLGQEDPLEEGMATHASILAWRIPMDREGWWTTVQGVPESDTTEATYTHIHTHARARTHTRGMKIQTHKHKAMLVPPTTSGTTSGDVNAEVSPAPFGSRAGQSQRLWMNFGNTLKSSPPLLIPLMHSQSVWRACPSQPLRQGEQPSEVAVTRGLLRGQTSPSSPAFWLALQIGCMPQRAPGRRLVCSVELLAQRYQRETLTNPGGMSVFWRPCDSSRLILEKTNKASGRETSQSWGFWKVPS